MPVSITDCAPQTEADLKSGTTLNQTPPNSGLFHTDPSCTVVNYDAAANEKVYQHGDAFIVFGTDRPSTKASGFGARGSSKAYHIDLVVGRMAGARKGKGAPEGSWVNNSFSADAARVYIGQLTDLDTNFGLAQDGAAFSDNGAKFGRSGVGIKADGIRIIGREGVKIVTGRALGVRGYGRTGENNSLGGSLGLAPKIELITGNSCPVDQSGKILGTILAKFRKQPKPNHCQPAVKGDNLRRMVEELIDYIQELITIIQEFKKLQSFTNTTLMTGLTAAGARLDTVRDAGISAASAGVQGIDQTMDVRVKGSLRKLNKDVGHIKFNYCNPQGEQYVCSESIILT